MTPAKLTQIGQLLYGVEWKRDMARLLGVNERTVRRWASGEYEMPDGIDSHIAVMIKDQLAAVNRIMLVG